MPGLLRRRGVMGKEQVSAVERLGLFSCARVVQSPSAKARGDYEQ